MKAIKNADGQVIGYIPDELPPKTLGQSHDYNVGDKVILFDTDHDEVVEVGEEASMFPGQPHLRLKKYGWGIFDLQFIKHA